MCSPLLINPKQQQQNTKKRYDFFKPFVGCPPSQPRKRYGNDADGGKELCDLGALPTPCTIYSLGSNGDFSFERAALAGSKCHVHTFDCTYDGASIDPARHTYHKWCVGTVKANRTDFKTYRDIVDELGHGRTGVALLKIDIEVFDCLFFVLLVVWCFAPLCRCTRLLAAAAFTPQQRRKTQTTHSCTPKSQGYEWETFAELRVSTPHLPQQISTELHIWVRFACCCVVCGFVLHASKHRTHLQLTNQPTNQQTNTTTKKTPNN